MFCEYSTPVGESSSLLVVSDPGNILGYSVGNGLWDAATSLVDYFASRPECVAGKTILELGSGLGVLGQVRSQ